MVRHLGRGHAPEVDMDAAQHDDVTIEHVRPARQAVASDRGECCS